MKMLSVAIDKDYVKVIDKLISSSGLYSSRSEFMKDAIRKNLVELIKLNENLKKIDMESKKLGEKARKRGYKGDLLSKKEREKLARAFAKEKGFI